MASGFGDMQSLLKQAQDMQKRMQDSMRALEERKIEASSGGGVVKVVVSGKPELLSVTIDKAAVDPDDVETLEDLVTTAMRQALAEAAKLREQETQKVTGGMNLPGLGF
ncbi:MAG: YbaB/EbfC family nucleoid-associated protein [Planctomycetota bacterium]